MDELKRKLAKIKPVIRVRKVDFEQNRSELIELLNQKKDLQKALSIKQKAYLDGVDLINEVRASKEREGLKGFEEGLDRAKEMWVEHYKRITRLEQEIERKIAAVAKAQKSLEAAEEMSERYLQEVKKWQEKKQQEFFDEVAGQAHHKKSLE